MKAALGALLLLVAGGEAQPPITYRVEVVKSKVLITHSGQERRARINDVALAGDELRTGWFGRTILAVPERTCRFEVFSSTRVRLAGREPGVLVVVERGRLKAIFDALIGNEERLVSTPGALLAVRGTRYGIEVDARGNGTLAVFEGVVEVRPRASGQPRLAVGAGELCQFGPAMAPTRRMMPGGMTEHRWDSGGAMGGMMGRGDHSGAGMTAPGQNPGRMSPPPSHPGGMNGNH